MSEPHNDSEMECELEALRVRTGELEKRVKRLEMNEEMLMQAMYALFPEEDINEPADEEYVRSEAVLYNCDPTILWVTRQAKRSLDMRHGRVQERGFPGRRPEAHSEPDK